MPLARRYSPEWAPGESSSIGIDMAAIIPVGVGISSGALIILTNTANPATSTDFSIGPVTVQGRIAYANLAGGVSDRLTDLRADEFVGDLNFIQGA